MRTIDEVKSQFSSGKRRVSSSLKRQHVTKGRRPEWLVVGSVREQTLEKPHCCSRADLSAVLTSRFPPIRLRDVLNEVSGVYRPMFELQVESVS